VKRTLVAERRRPQRRGNAIALLKRKYDAESHYDLSPSSPLFPILLKLEDGMPLSRDDEEWLKAHRLHATVAHHHQAEFRRTANPRRLVWASSALRQAGKPEQALALTDHLLSIISITQRDVRAEVLTTRGGAFRDLLALDDAERCAREAIRCRENHHPYNLLGAIYFMRGEPEEGDRYFERARVLGATPREEQFQMAGALRRSGSEQRRVVAEYLLKKDPARYRWAATYLR
jgi:tetratricopeptide (TPR) repeat protein